MVTLAVGDTADVARAVKESAPELDFVEGEIGDLTLASRSVAQDRLVIVVPSTHPFAATDTLRAADSSTQSRKPDAEVGRDLAAEPSARLRQSHCIGTTLKCEGLLLA